MIKVERRDYPFVTASDTRMLVPFLGLGDFHYGAATCNVKKLKEIVKWVQENKAYWVGMGDYIECATRTSPGSGVYQQVTDPETQLQDIVGLLKPIAPYCMGLLKGNHEERVYKAVGIDPTQSMSRDLGVPCFGWEGFGMVIRDAAHSAGYSFYAVHSYVGNKSAGLALNWIEREIDKWCNADIVMRGHSHDIGYDVKMVLNVNKQKHNVTSDYRYAIMTGHYMERPDSYIASRGNKPKPSGTVALWLHMDGRDRKVRPEYIL